MTAPSLHLYDPWTKRPSSQPPMGAARNYETPVMMQEPRVEADCNGGAGEHRREEGSQSRLPSDRAENKPDAPVVIAGVPHFTRSASPVASTAGVARTIVQAGVTYEILIDAQDEHYLDEGSWEIFSSRNTHYVRGTRCNPLGRRFLHCVIMGDEIGIEVDHRDGNGLDVRRANLRPATRQQNASNRVKGNFKNATSPFKGVYERAPGRFVAQITVKRKNQHLGSFKSEEEAARRYDRAALEAFGEFAKLNFQHANSEVQS